MGITAKKFKNFSDQDFAWKFDGVEYGFKAGETMYLEDSKAAHFAKHLIDRELNKKNIPTDRVAERAKLELLCFPSDEVVTPVEAINIEAKKEEVARVEIKAKKNIKNKKVEQEEEFADLNK
jgi:hypothetical protein